MKIRKIALNGFRNYDWETAEFSPDINVITGRNAQGKTNLLEAVYLLSCGRSFRTRLDRPHPLAAGVVAFGGNHVYLGRLAGNAAAEKTNATVGKPTEGFAAIGKPRRTNILKCHQATGLPGAGAFFFPLPELPSASVS